MGFGAHSAFHAVCCPPTEVSGKVPLPWSEEPGNMNWNFLVAIAATSVLVYEYYASPGNLKVLE